MPLATTVSEGFERGMFSAAPGKMARDVESKLGIGDHLDSDPNVSRADKFDALGNSVFVGGN